MKNIKNYKNFVAGLITGLLIVTAGVSATTPGGTLGGLFELISSSENGNPATSKYVLNGINIKDNSISMYELADNSVGTAQIENGTIQAIDIGSGVITTNNIDLSNFELSASNITAGTFNSGDYKFPASLEINSDLKVLGDIYEGGSKLSNKYLGIGSTAVNSDKLAGDGKAFYTNASNIGSGTLDNARLDSNVSLLGQKIEESELSTGVQDKLNNLSGKVNLGTKWTIAPNGDNIEFKYNGVTQIIFSGTASGTGIIEATQYNVK